MSDREDRELRAGLREFVDKSEAEGAEPTADDLVALGAHAQNFWRLRVWVRERKKIALLHEALPVLASARALAEQKLAALRAELAAHAVTGEALAARGRDLEGDLSKARTAELDALEEIKHEVAVEQVLTDFVEKGTF